MADYTTYRVKVKGTKDECYAFMNSMSQSDEIQIHDEKGTDDKYTLLFQGQCKWFVDAYCKSWIGSFDIEIPKTEEEAWQYQFIYAQDRSKLFNVDVWVNEVDEEMTSECYQHFKCGEYIKDKKMPPILKFDMDDPDCIW